MNNYGGSLGCVNNKVTINHGGCLGHVEVNTENNSVNHGGCLGYVKTNEEKVLIGGMHWVVIN